MQYNTDRIRTSHVGRLPTPKDFADMPARLARADVTDPQELDAKVVPVVADIVRRQVEVGVDIVNDGEFFTAHAMSAHYAAHFSGLTIRPVQPGETASSHLRTRERDDFPDFYAAMDEQKTMFFVPGERPYARAPERTVVSGPLKSKGQEAIKREIGVFKAAIERSGVKVEEAFLAVLAPGWFDHFIHNEFYATEEEFLLALADAIAEEYRAVVDAGFILQIDDPGLPDWWDMLEARAHHRRLSQVRQAAYRCREPRLEGHSRGQSALSPVLGQLARPAHPRSAAGAHRRPRVAGERAELFLRGRQCAPRA